MIVLDVTTIRARMLRHYGRLKREAAGKRDSLIHLLAHGNLITKSRTLEGYTFALAPLPAE